MEWKKDLEHNTHECWVDGKIRFDIEEDDGCGNIRIYDMNEQVGWSLIAPSVEWAKKWCEQKLI